ncbi:MAG TPA: long-chain fatty acid--CoA ligase [Anaeromyxobacteraceae bacterium]|nr:long-chain fatty acid--CoA ligase [Anaeromyxobacteraceae bacterium]
MTTTSRNLVQVFEEQVQRRGDAPALTYKRDGSWRTTTWKELGRRVRDVADGLVSLGVKPGDRVSIVADTCPEWIVADVAIMSAGAITVPIYQSNPAHEVQYILQDAGARWVFVDHDHQAAKIREEAARLPEVQGVIRFFGDPQAAHEHTLAAVENRGVAFREQNPGSHAERVAAVKPDQPASFLYTSGTTGNPKGVVLTHGAWTYEAEAVAELKIVRQDDTVLLFLPMAHSFAKVIEAVWFGEGAVAAFVESLDKIVDNAGEVKPTVMPSVPRIFEKAYDAVLAKGLSAPGVKGWLFGLAMNGFDAWVEGKQKGMEVKTFGFRIGEKLVFPKLAAALAERFGGRMRLFVSGGAPLSPKINWFFTLLGFTILEGYGLTETSAGTCVNRIGKNKIGTVGPPVPGSEIRIAEDGEILIKGPGVMKEYFRRPEATAEVLKDGWFATGDIGELDADGYLRITDRKKDLIKTSGGKYIAPQNLENELKADPIISQVMVHGDQRKFVVALVTLSPENARKWATENGVGEDEALHTNPKVKARIQQAIDALNAKQASYATIKKFAILEVDFSQERGDLTPTLKVKRKVVTERHKKLLDSFYAE